MKAKQSKAKQCCSLSLSVVCLKTCVGFTWNLKWDEMQSNLKAMLFALFAGLAPITFFALLSLFAWHGSGSPDASIPGNTPTGLCYDDSDAGFSVLVYC
jgi:hypothetical protein